MASCSGPARRAHDAPHPAPPEIIEIVRLEGSRTGAPRLLALAATGPPSVRARAIVALGRHGDETNVATIVGWLSDADLGVRSAAAEALGIIGAPAAVPGLRAALAVKPYDAAHVAVATALGRCGEDADAALALAKTLAAPDADATLRSAAARALGAFGHRKKPLPDAAITALFAAAGVGEAASGSGGATLPPGTEVRHAAAYAFMRLVADPLPRRARVALVALATDANPETRALAVRGLAAHHAGDEAVVTAALDDADWRVRVQAVRALGADAPDGGAAQRARLAAWLARELHAAETDASRWAGPESHALIEALTKLAPYATEAEVAKLYGGARASIAKAEASETEARGLASRLALSTADCLVTAALARAELASRDDVLACGGAPDSGLPVHERARLAVALAGRQENPELPAEVLVARNDAALAFLARLWPDPDARVRGAVAEAAVAHLPDARAEQLVLDALDDRDPLVVGSAADALAGRLAAPDAPAAEAILRRAAARVSDALGAEVHLGLVGALCAGSTPSREALNALHVAHTSPSVVVRTAARECITKITAADPGPGAPSAPEPATPADPTQLIGRGVVLTVTTTRGDFAVALDPELAPWNVATLTVLAEKGFYDGTLWHRVVPDFVVQGGDPTGSGWGGPGFTVPAEASNRRYVRGTVGIADAGKDTGGSQWFVMHSASPHLEQRYTIVGQVTEGMDVVDRLHVGDRIVRVKVSVRTPVGAPARAADEPKVNSGAPSPKVNR